MRVVVDVVSVNGDICRHNTDVNIGTTGTRHVILAKHWMWLPDDGFM